MDPVLLARIQFAMTIGFHFIFPAVTIGLAWLLVVVEGMGWRTGDEAWRSAGRFFGKVFALTFAVGVATGIVMEFQFGTNWATYSRFVGDVFGAPLAAEGVFAFFLESGFLGLYLFGRGRVSPGLHWFSILMVAVGATLSAFWILVANSWQQTPDGHVLNEALSRVELVSFTDAVFNPSTWVRFNHTMSAALLTGAFFMAGISAHLIVKKRAEVVARKSLAASVIFGFVASVLVVFPTGHGSATQVARDNKEKLAAIEGLTKGQEGAPLMLFGLFRPEEQVVEHEVSIPGALSLLAYGSTDAYVHGLSDFPEEDRPTGNEVWLAFVSFHNMVILGTMFLGLMGLALLLLWRRRLFGTGWLLRVLTLSIPLPILACELGWITAEVGRQPWVVYKLLRTKDAASVIVSSGEILFSIVLFGLIYALLGAVWIYLLAKKVKHGPDPVGTPQAGASEVH